jgi:predicted DNA-binding antitoxin AbrB/MazE fold protein
MTQILEATFDGEVFRPLKAVQLPVNTRVQLEIKVEKELSNVSFLDIAEGLQLEDPSDWSVRVDDYLNADLSHA